MNKPKMGDWVRVVVEGKLQLSVFGGDKDIKIGGNYYPPVGKSGVVSIEVIPAPFVLPTKLGARMQIVASQVDLTKFAHRDAGSYSWISTGGMLYTEDDLIEMGDLHVISEGIDE